MRRYGILWVLSIRAYALHFYRHRHLFVFFSDWLVGMPSFDNPAIAPVHAGTHVLIYILATDCLPLLAAFEYAL
jgi:hypothetical protein